MRGVMQRVAAGQSIVASMGPFKVGGLRLGRMARSMALLCAIGSMAALAIKAQVAWAQDQTERVVQGKVVDRAGDGVKAQPST